ncbi:hypothetical protein K3555_23645 (plasmid) [Leisingera sp. M527]|uniref:hypothetical protein n=1 Tax=Leisingera sp. M527 TaxID=2867014 RepID=UPI0021A5BDE3|nr:hypothetical protein [Leisingera sp. M527]UWQ35491.1 hypothetical protein K3555_23645 [Leisingera sp. M527]
MAIRLILLAVVLVFSGGVGLAKESENEFKPLYCTLLISLQSEFPISIGCSATSYSRIDLSGGDVTMNKLNKLGTPIFGEAWIGSLKVQNELPSSFQQFSAALMECANESGCDVYNASLKDLQFAAELIGNFGVTSATLKRRENFGIASASRIDIVVVSSPNGKLIAWTKRVNGISSRRLIDYNFSIYRN